MVNDIWFARTVNATGTVTQSGGTVTVSSAYTGSGSQNPSNGVPPGMLVIG